MVHFCIVLKMGKKTTVRVHRGLENQIQSSSSNSEAEQVYSGHRPG